MDSGIECTLSEFANDTKLCGTVNKLDGRDAIQRELDRFEREERDTVSEQLYGPSCQLGLNHYTLESEVQVLFLSFQNPLAVYPQRCGGIHCKFICYEDLVPVLTVL
ncbi:rna-directed dna polymerase from mobile element jockey-like [Limosa lapponica baueri]|uniref:Rna-directed dna polymerase from mobile element jockey-like n=1 Tax=Limosa lapponica baueri TaxID=1758121 RepID=A0A2I0UL46_LIMLA|nr:rna-directed dna polymerase from mobile element jockey-like [Limosa lapponica baueri]